MEKPKLRQRKKAKLILKEPLERLGSSDDESDYLSPRTRFNGEGEPETFTL